MEGRDYASLEKSFGARQFCMRKGRYGVSDEICVRTEENGDETYVGAVHEAGREM